MDFGRGVWVFVGNGAHFPSAVFSSKDVAVEWISEHQLSGCLTLYPLDISSYDWSVQNGYFRPKRPEHETPDFIQKFSSGAHEHEHFVNGKGEDER